MNITECKSNPPKWYIFFQCLSAFCYKSTTSKFCGELNARGFCAWWSLFWHDCMISTLTFALNGLLSHLVNAITKTPKRRALNLAEHEKKCDQSFLSRKPIFLFGKLLCRNLYFRTVQDNCSCFPHLGFKKIFCDCLKGLGSNFVNWRSFLLISMILI